ncbi:MAG: TonB-dependent receptor [Chitinophagaceae bacterium]
MRKSTKRLLSFAASLLLLFIVGSAMAQSAIIKGTVKDASGKPLVGASVTVEPRNIGTTTDANGNYTLKVPAGDYMLVVSYVGQATQRLSVTVKAGETSEQDLGLTAAGEVETVRVVGSRSNTPRTVISTPVPVDVISAKEIKQFAQTDITQLLTYAAPSFQSARQTVTDGTDHIDPAGLRGLGPDQTLVLLNGKRRHTTALVNINGSVGRGSVGTDMNAIPVAAIERIEVLRDGAAAQYGSDAIAGVINIVLKKKYKGAAVSVNTGGNVTNMPYFTDHQKINDGNTTQVDFSVGTFSKGAHAGYINFSGQWLNRDKTNRSAYDNIPLLYYGNGGSFPATQSGVDPVAYRRWLIDLDKGLVNERGYDRHNMVAGQSSSENFGGFVNAGINITKNIEFYTTIGASHRTGEATGNARLPNAVTQQAITTGGYSFYPDGFLPEIHTIIKDQSFIAGLRGKYMDWDIDLSNTYGENKLDYGVENSLNASLPAVDVASVQTKFNAGGLKFRQNTVNLDFSKKFEAGGNDLNVGFGGEFRTEKFDIEAGELNSYTNGGRLTSPYALPGYPGSNTSPSVVGASPAVPGAQVFPGFSPADMVNAKRNVYAGYIDLEYTLGKLLLGGAARYESYKESSVTYNGTGLKLTARYEIKTNLAVRGSVSTGFRAPSLHQRYFQNTSTQFVGGLPSNSLTANNENPIVRTAFGINELKPEKSVSFTAGIVSKFGNGFTASLDGYFISIKDRIVLSTAFNRASNPLVNAILVANNVSSTTSALQFWTNAVNTETKGIDIVISKRYKIGVGSGNISLAGNFNQNTVVGKIHTNSVIDAAVNNPSLTDPTKNPANDFSTLLFDRQQRARIEVGQPKQKVNLTANYTVKKFDILARVVYFGKVTALNAADPYATNAAGMYWSDAGFGADQTYKGKATTDLVLTYKACAGINVSVGANNLLDVYPDQIFIDPRNSATSVYATPVASALGTSKVVGGYTAGRDQSNRGRFLFSGNQFGYNGRYLFARLAVDFLEAIKGHKMMKPAM